MTRMFLRLWLMAVGLFVTFTAVHDLIVILWSSERENQVAYDYIKGGFRLAVAHYDAAEDKSSEQAVLNMLEVQFDVPVVLVDRAEIPPTVETQLQRGWDLLYRGEGLRFYLLTPLSDSTELLEFGPYPEWPLPDPWSRLALVGVAALGFAGALWLGLRPLNRQQRALEVAADTIAEGEFSARVDAADGAAAPTVAVAFNRMAERTETTLASQQALLRAVSHELRTPIARLRIGVHLLSQASDDREARAAALDGDLQELDDLVDELLTAARLDGGAAIREPEALALVEVVTAVLEQHRPLVGEVQLVVGTGVLSAPRVLADRRLLHRAVGNLVGNAARHAQKRVLVDAAADGESVRFWVEDDGPGIPELDRERAFQAFTRLEERAHGHGMGLAIVRSIVTWHGGEAAIESGAAGGCRVVLRWPCADPSDHH